MVYKIEILKSEDSTNQHIEDRTDKSVFLLDSYHIDTDKTLTTDSVPSEIHNITSDILKDFENGSEDEMVFSYIIKTTIRIKKSVN